MIIELNRDLSDRQEQIKITDVAFPGQDCMLEYLLEEKVMHLPQHYSSLKLAKQDFSKVCL